MAGSISMSIRRSRRHSSGGFGVDSGQGREFQVPADEQVQVPVAVVVSEGRRRGPSRHRDPGPVRDIRETPVAVVAIEPVPAEIGDVEIGPAVVVVVPDDGAETPTFVGHSRRGRGVGEGAVAVVAIEGRLRMFLLASNRLEAGTVDQVDVDPAVPVVVEEGHASGRDLHQETFHLRSGAVSEAAQTASRRDVGEDHGRSVDETARRDGTHHLVPHGSAGGPGRHGAFILAGGEVFPGGNQQEQRD